MKRVTSEINQSKKCIFFVFIKQLYYNARSTECPMFISLPVKCPLFLSGSSKTYFLCRVSKNPQILNFIKFRPESHFFMVTDTQTDGLTDGRTNRHDEAKSRFSQFCERA